MKRNKRKEYKKLEKVIDSASGESRAKKLACVKARTKLIHL